MTFPKRLRLPAALRLTVLLSAAAATGAPPPPPLYAVSAATITVDPSVSIATLSGAMNGAGMEELNHEIYGGVYSQMYALDTLSAALFAGIEALALGATDGTCWFSCCLCLSTRRIHGESFEEPPGPHGVSGERFFNAEQDGNTT